MTDIKSEIRSRLGNPEFVLGKLGLLETAKKARNGFNICCLWHSENEPSCNVRQHPNDGTLSVHCFGCKQSADVFELIAQVYDINIHNSFPEILQIAGDFAGVQVESGKPFTPTPPPKFVERPPEYPPIDELRDMWTNAVSVTEDPEAKKWFKDRGLSVERLNSYCKVIPKNHELPKWAIFKDDDTGRYDWIMSGHRLIFPLYNYEGKIRSFRARCLNEGTYKNVNPLGYSTKNLCFADTKGLDALKGNKSFEVLNFVEGEGDFLAAIQREDSFPIFGFYSGGWSLDHSKACGRESEIFFPFDDDRAGDGYKKDIVKSFLENN